MIALALGMVAIYAAALLLISTPIFPAGPRLGARLLLVAVILIGAHTALEHRHTPQDRTLAVR